MQYQTTRLPKPNWDAPCIDRENSGSSAKFTAMCRASSRMTVERRPGSPRDLGSVVLRRVLTSVAYFRTGRVLGSNPK